MVLRPEALYRAVETRDARFDGRFFTGVVTTGIYCRPVCPSRTPRASSCVFFRSAAAAAAAGFRACLRCRPEVAPRVAAWTGTAAVVSRALRLLDDGAFDRAGVDALAGKLGIGARHLRRLFLDHLGAPPVAVAQARRALFAKALLQETRLPVGDVALAAGFGSLRRFNAVMRRALGRAPGEVRRGRAPADGPDVTLRLPYTPPYDWDAMAAFLGARAIPGVEEVFEGGWRRLTAGGTVEVRPGKGALMATIRCSRLAMLPGAVVRLRRLFDLDADARAIGRHLSRDPLLAPLVKARPGLRVPGAWDGFELAVRAVLGQQISVAGARTLAGRIAERFGAAPRHPAGDLRRVFPGPERIAGADLSGIGLPKARARAISALAAHPELPGPAATLEDAVERLARLPGFGPWTAHYVAMRALGEPDAFPSGDLGLMRATGLTAAALQARAERWRPWRAYAAIHLWAGGPR